MQLSATNITFSLLFRKSFKSGDILKDTHPIWKELEILNKNQRVVIDYLRHLPIEKHSELPPKGWAMIQALRHIQVSESTSVAYLNKKKLAGDALKESGLKSSIALSLINVAFKSGLKFKAPAVLKDPQITSLEELIEDWEQTREQIRLFLEEYPEKWESKAVYRHPFAGMLNVNDTIRFFNIHQNHHIRQVHRIAKHLTQ
jgi:hypothetical protein